MSRSDYIHRVRFENPGEPVPDGDGGYTVAYTTFQSVWFAAIRPMTAKDFESETSGTITANASHVIQADYHPGVNIKSRVVKLDDGRTFDVAGLANHDERDITMSLYCLETI